MKHDFDQSKARELWDRGSVAYVNLKAWCFDMRRIEQMEVPFPVVEALKHLMAVYDPEEYALWFAPKTRSKTDE